MLSVLLARLIGFAFSRHYRYFMLGVSTALDTLASQAHGAGDSGAVRRWAVIAAAVLLAMCIPAAALLWLSEWFVERWFAQPPPMAR